MGHYFFNTSDGDELLGDEEGLDLDSTAAVRMAHPALFELASEGVPYSGPSKTHSVTVRDNERHVVYGARLIFSGTEF
jgi:hypothetical protein